MRGSFKICTSHPTLWMIKTRRMRWVEQVACVEQRRKAYRVLARKLEEKRQLGRPRGR
jgi:hypothetical protein